MLFLYHSGVCHQFSRNYCFAVERYVGRRSWLDAVDENFAHVGADFHPVFNFSYQPSSVACFHGSTMSAIAVRCPQSMGLLHGTADGSRRRWRPRSKSWRANIRELTGLLLSSPLRIAADRSRWAAIAEQTFVGISHSPTALRRNVGSFVIVLSRGCRLRCCCSDQSTGRPNACPKYTHCYLLLFNIPLSVKIYRQNLLINMWQTKTALLA